MIENKVSVAIVGSSGIPASYGGFETLAENLVSRSKQVSYSVICSGRRNGRSSAYKGARRKFLPLKANGAQSIIYDFLGMICSLQYEEILLLGVSAGIFLPFVRLIYHGKIIVHVDGIEWKRDKWRGISKYFLRFSEHVAVRFSDVTISDNAAISKYIFETYGKTCTYISYGGDSTEADSGMNAYEFCQEALETTGGRPIPRNYALTVCRIEPENNVDTILKAFQQNPELNLVLVGNWSNSKWSRRLKHQYQDYRNIYLLDSIYDAHILDRLRSNAQFYVHGNSVGGTNPSLVEAMTKGLPIIAFDVVFNRVTTENRAIYFKDVSELSSILNSVHCSLSPMQVNGWAMKEIARRSYRWEIIVSEYENMFCQHR